MASTACDAALPQADAGPPSVELGTGQRSFEAIANGDSIFIVEGPQAGFHFYGSVRAQNVNPGDSGNLQATDNPITRFEVFVDDQRVDAMGSSYQQGLKKTPDGAEMIGRTIILDIEADDELDGKVVRFVVTIDDADGNQVTDQRSLIAIPHPNNR